MAGLSAAKMAVLKVDDWAAYWAAQSVKTTVVVKDKLMVVGKAVG